MSVEGRQKEICARWGADFLPPKPFEKLGIADGVRSGVLPINGLRHQPHEETSGWFVWAGGEPSQDRDYFHPLHIAHADEWYAGLGGYLALPPGWRFQIAPGHEDVWFDESLVTSVE